MSIQLLRDDVYERCKKKLADFDNVEDAPVTQIHNTIRKGFEIELRTIINSFVMELSKSTSVSQKTAVVLNFSERFSSKEFKRIFKQDIHYSDEHKRKCIKDCDILDPRTTKGFLFENKTKDDKTKDFYCVFLGKFGWNSWMEEFSPANFIISTEHNNTDNSIVQRYEIRDLPKILNSVPVLEIENYIPRITILEEIFNLFEQKNKKINITGISGIGKTFLAKHFVQHYSEKFSHIVWLNCSSGILKAFTQGNGIALLDIMGLASEYKSYTEGNMTDEGLMNMVLGRIKNLKGNNILLLDNLNDEIYDYEEELNFATNWKTLSTSQEKLDEFYNFSAPYFNEGSATLFYKFYHLEKDDDNLQRLLSSIEYHTLVIELLAKTAQQRQLKIIELVNRFIKNGINVVDKVKVISKHNKERKIKIKNIEQYLNLIFDVSSLHEEECKLLLNIALLQSDSILEDLFKEVYLNNSDDKNIEDKFIFYLDCLIKKGWVQKDNNTIKVHGLIKSIVIKKFLHKQEFYNSTVEYLIKVLSIEWVENAIKKIDFLTIAENVLKSIAKKNETTVALKKAVTIFYFKLGLNKEAFDNEFEIANTALENENKSDNYLDIIISLNNMSCILINQKRYDEALEYCLRVYEFFDDETKEKLFFKSVDSLSNFFISKDIRDLSDFNEKFAIISQLKLINIISTSVNNIGLIYYNENKYNDALYYLEKSYSSRKTFLEIFENNLPINLALSISIYKEFLLSNTYTSTTIGLCYQELSQYDKAEEYLMLTLNVQERILEGEHIDLSLTFHNLTLHYIRRENITQATYFLNRNKEISDNLPRNHPNVAYYKDDIKELEVLKNRIFESANIKKAIEVEFEILHQKNSAYTPLREYYSTLSKIYISYNNYNKVCENIEKEILFIPEIEKNERFNKYLTLGSCYLNLMDFENALQVLDNLLNISVENQNNDETFQHKFLNYQFILVKGCLNENYKPIIKLLLSNKLQELENEYTEKFSLFSRKLGYNLIPIKNQIFHLLYDSFGLTHIQYEIIQEDTSNDFDLSLNEYEVLTENIIKVFSEGEYNTLIKYKIQYLILDDFYQMIISLFLQYESWINIAKYCDKRIAIIEKHLNSPKKLGATYYDLAYSFYQLNLFEESLIPAQKAVQNYGKALEDLKNDINEIEFMQMLLNDALNLEKMIDEELKNYRK